jgi:hypothetical protein
MSEKSKFISKVNKLLHALPTYSNEIPLDDIFQIVKENGGLVVQEDGTPWSGILCGEKGNCNLKVEGFKNVGLSISWYKMSKGRYEIVSYVS